MLSTSLLVGNISKNFPDASTGQKSKALEKIPRRFRRSKNVLKTCSLTLQSVQKSFKKHGFRHFGRLRNEKEESKYGMKNEIKNQLKIFKNEEKIFFIFEKCFGTHWGFKKHFINICPDT